MTQRELIAIAKRFAVTSEVDPALVCAIVEQESGWDTHAIRWEPAFFARYVVPQNIKNQTEATARAFSWGLMQVMGQVAREIGFKGKFLSELTEPEVGLEVGCWVFKNKFKKANGDVRKALLLWNGGGRPAYADEVLARVERYK